MSWFISHIRSSRAAPALIAAFALAFTACGSEPIRAVLNEYEVFIQQPKEDDSLADETIAKLLGGVEVAHLRRVGVFESTVFYAALFNPPEEESGRLPGQGLCFIAVNDAQGLADSVCEHPDNLKIPIVQLHIRGDADPSDAFLIPDEAKIMDVPSGWMQVSPNVVAVVDPEQAPREVRGLLVNSGEKFTLTRDS